MELGGWPIPDLRPETMGCYTCYTPIPYKIGGGYCDECCPVTRYRHRLEQFESEQVQRIYEMQI